MNIGGYALVTGAGMQSFSRIHPTDRPPLTSLRSGIGLTCAQRYAEKNAADVAFADLDLRTAERAAEESLGLMTNPDYRAIFIRVDVTQETDVEDMVKETRKEFGRIDHAVNCAGVNLVARVSAKAKGEIAEQTTADLDDVMNVNYKDMYYCVRAEINAMKEQEPRTVSPRDPNRGVTRGTIVNLGSLAPYAAVPGNSAHGTSKHAVLGLSKYAALDAAKYHIRVNYLCPSWVDTPMVRRMLDKRPGARGDIERMTPMGPMAQPGEVADVAIFLSSPKSSYVTGVG
ncbi:MAG: hypothetical protein ALECFALPRED_009120 [Alectoria fallacina]|uniref:NAD(P)-binding protein n=1 Tax=Alectoria fallacina TaxID=1903189 RepID=A0A8H3F0S4_9LECA|nr:MAG: hypothetical protein ALECFALPRED_009120 [Alectoria fallacina]